jgi:ABC-type transport system involved in multi-copper enzyme maturation permease subunit
MILLTFARLTVVEAARRRVLWALGGMAVLIVGLSFWAFARLPAVHASGPGMSTADAHFATAEVLSFVLFALSFVGALGMSFVATPTIAGELQSGVAQSVLARPVSRCEVLMGKWLGLATLAVGYVAVVGAVEIAAAEIGTGYHVPQPAAAIAFLAMQAVALLSLALLLSTLLSSLAAGIVSVGLFGTAWVAGLVGDLGASLNDHSLIEVGTVDHLLIPTDGLWRGVVHALDDPAMTWSFVDELTGNPFVQRAGMTAGYLGWTVAWTAAVLIAAHFRFARAEP